MKNMFVLLAVFVFCFTLSTGGTPPDAQAENIITIGTGAVTGVFYQAGGAISRIVNKKREEYGIRCSVESTDGSVYNINAVISGELDFGFAQSDRHYQAVHGLAEWKPTGRLKKLRSMFSLYSEACTLCAAADSGINNIRDLRGKKVNLGNPGSGHRQNSIDALAQAGIDYKKDLTAESVKASDASRLLQQGKLDAFFYTVGHPTGAILNATSGKRKVKIIPMPVIASKLTRTYPYYVRTRVPVEYYRSVQNRSDVDTFGVRATFVTSDKVSNLVAYAITKEIFENFNYFKSLHVAFEGLTQKDMLENLAAPIHPGAMRYYKEAGLK
ncbi:TAXI family TRAP transporter solute-binding subunit [Desulfonema magnum]|uniref:TRAP transporter, receptor protein n=1 Tax=Desulfonema magnum TaxID=45655 RepID=A0A975BHI2_9BACT|nr:TAXI family TRAP transporter solute-binding subunit [Desulfonema magnum]QTA85314.1 TRAP transporter, receptor protein [Desulfonema magnum]